LRLLVAAAAALLLSGCEVYAVPSPLPCPGERQGVFNFVATQVLDPADCVFAQPGPSYQVASQITFPGTISFASDGTAGAAVCKDQPHALPNLGTHADIDLDVASVFLVNVGGCNCPSPEAAAAVRCSCPADSPTTGCLCPVLQEQRITGSLIPVPGGYSGFEGLLLFTVSPPPAADPAQACDCQAECTYSYDLAATAVGSR
jgi:hypothetical protein